MARKPQKKSTAKRSSRKILDAFQIAERAENGSGSDSDAPGQNEDIIDGIMDATRFLKEGRSHDAKDDEFVDEEIDSDEVMGSDDDYDVMNSKFSQTIRDKAKKSKEKARKIKRGQYDSADDSSESDLEYHSIDESQMVGLSEAWDLDEQDLKKATASSNLNDVVLNDAWESASSESESENDSESEAQGDDSDSGSGSDGDDSDDSEESDSDVFANESGDDNVELTSTAKAIASKIKKAPSERKRLFVENRDENEFSVPAGSQKLSLQDMMAVVDTNVADDAILLHTHDKEKSKALATPLPKRIQDRHDRGVAYEITKEEVNKWKDTVRQNRDAEVLKFPMNPTTDDSAPNHTFQADEKSNELESRINDLLKQSALVDESKEATFEEIAMAKMSPAELKKRTNELRQMRELMFRDEMRAKRIKKIKSKQYHKIQKRERLRNEELVEGSESEDEDHDKKRAQERMTLKHKTQSQWAKSMIKSGMSKDASSRSELEEMLRQGERLRAKQVGHEEGEQSDDQLSDLEREYANDDVERDEKSRSSLGKGVLAMDFMKEAERRTKEENELELENMRRLEGEDALDILKTTKTAVNITHNQGRRVYAPKAGVASEEMLEISRAAAGSLGDEEASELLERLDNNVNAPEHRDNRELGMNEGTPKAVRSEPTENLESENPWLASKSQTKQRLNKVTAIDQSSSRLSKAAAKIAKANGKNVPAASDADVTIDMNNTLKQAVLRVHDNEDSHDEDDGVPMFTQSELIREAFAGDDVMAEFEEEKRQVVVDEDDKEEDLTLPGWGDWAGEGFVNKKRRIVRKIDGVAQKDLRKDKNMKGVIINERVNKKNLKYQSSGVPFPFESREQYERSLRMPVGQEWTSRATHQKLTMPRIITKQGTVIDPLKTPF